MPSTPKRIEILGGILRHLGTFDITTFKGRLVLQKTVYLLQAMGIFLGYRFSWYLYGPYSPDLARHGFELESTYRRLGKYEFSTAAQKQLFKDFVKFLGNRRGEPIWLEAVASIHFLRALYPSQTKEEIVKRVIEKQSYFNHSICNEAWKSLDEAGLLRS